MVSKVIMDQRRESGLCIYCANPQSENSICMCEACIERSRVNQKKRRKKFRDAGLCIKCGKKAPSDKHSKCEDCLDLQMNAYRERRKSQKTNKRLCLDCGIQIGDSGRVCQDCHVKRVSVKRTGSVANWEMLKKKFHDQKGLCPYSGKQLTLAIDADLDHIVPKSMGGKDQLQNLQWVWSKVNQMKWNLVEQEFLDIVKSIYKNRFDP